MPAPAPVIAVAGGACFGQPVGLDANASSDADGAIKSFDWDLGDGARASGAEVSHVYGDPGVYNVVLTADDGSRAAEQPSGCLKGVPCQPSAFGVRRAGSQRLRWRRCRLRRRRFDRLGRQADGISLGLRRWRAADGGAGRPSFTQPGTYPVRLTVTDNSGSPCASAEAISQIHVNAPPQVSLGGDREASQAGRMTSCCSMRPDRAIRMVRVWNTPGTSATARRARARSCATPMTSRASTRCA